MNLLKNKKILILLFVALFLITGVILIERAGSQGIVVECGTCIDLTASPTTIYRGESSTLTLKVNNTPDSFAICTITRPDGSKIIEDKSLNDGNYNYTVWPGGGNPGNFTYAADCTGGGGQVSDNITITVNNKVPNVPTLIAPPHNVWISYNPTFRARVSDPEGDNVRAKFGVDGYGEFWGGWVASGNISENSSQSIPDGTYNWRALAQDKFNDTGNWSGYWKLKKDTTKPWAQISYPTGAIPTSFTVTLTEGDTTSGVTEGDVDIRINGGSWQNYTSTINNFTFTGTFGNTYEFRYRVKDNAGIWSDFDYGGSVIIDTPPTATPLPVDQGDYCAVPLHPIFSWTFSDPDPGGTQGAYQIQVDGRDSGKIYSSSNSYTFPSSFSYNRTYSWQLKVWDNYDAESGWISGPSFKTSDHAWPYPDFTWSPSSPTEGELVQFCATQQAGVCPEDVSTCYDLGGPIPSCSGKTILWTFPAGTEFATGTSPASENPRVKFDSTGPKDVSLRITDDVGSCTITKSVGVMLPLPRWKEVAP